MPDETIALVVWAVCPILRAADEFDMPQIINGPHEVCRKCPAGDGPDGATAGCRIIAELVARAAGISLDAAGYVIVPKEPTEAMIEAGRRSIATWIGAGYGDEAQRNRHAIRWRAMIEARPK